MRPLCSQKARDDFESVHNSTTFFLLANIFKVVALILYLYQISLSNFGAALRNDSLPFNDNNVGDIFLL